MDDYFYNLVVGKVSLSRNHEGKDKEDETTYHILSLFFILVHGKLSKLVVETMFWGNICIAYDQQRADISNVQTVIMILSIR